MAGQKPTSAFGHQQIRSAVWAGLFYPADPVACQSQARAFLDQAMGNRPAESRPGRLIGGIVPHAGWVYSGAVAGETVAALAQQQREVDVVVVFGAIHTPMPTDVAALDPHQRWIVPGGASDISDEVAQKLAGQASLFRIDERFHRREHAVEVELPLIQQAWPDATVLPIEVPVNAQAAQVGIETARRLVEANRSPVFLASSDLTHYGPRFGLTPMGIGPAGVRWAMDNDRRLLDLIAAMQVERIVPEVCASLNACGGGAIAAMLAACREMGASRATVIRHTSSYETAPPDAPRDDEHSVGYASVVVG